MTSESQQGFRPLRIVGTDCPTALWVAAACVLALGILETGTGLIAGSLPVFLVLGIAGLVIGSTLALALNHPGLRGVSGLAPRHSEAIMVATGETLVCAAAVTAAATFRHWRLP